MCVKLNPFTERDIEYYIWNSDFYSGIYLLIPKIRSPVIRITLSFDEFGFYHFIAHL